MRPQIPTKEENPNGLHQRYIVTHSEDMPDDPDALYFVLKLNSKDPVHCRACRLAAWQYIDEIRRSNRLPLLPIGNSHVPPPHQRPTKAQLEVASNLEQLLIQTQNE